jgi:hypothetical protein
MSVPAILFLVYFVIGLLLMVVAVASRGKEKRTKGFEASGSGDAFDAGLMFFIALLWPLWLASLMKKDPKE